MKTQRDWTKVTLLVVLALTSLSSIATSAPHRDRLDVHAAPLAPVGCSESNVDRFNQYLAAIEWTDNPGTATPLALSVSCGKESLIRFEQYLTALEATDQARAVAPAPIGEGTQERFEQYQAAIGASESTFATIWHNIERFEQYMAATGQ